MTEEKSFCGMVRCEKCKTKVRVVNLPYEDKRIHINLLVCSNCGDVLTMFVGCSGDFPLSELIKIRDELIQKYGLDFFMNY